MYFLTVLHAKFGFLGKISLERSAEYLSLSIFVLSALSLVALEQKQLGYSLVAIGIALLAITSSKFRKHFALIYTCLIILSLTPIGTSTKLPQAMYMGIGLAAVVLIPLFVTRKLYKDRTIRFPSLHDRHWPKERWFYLLFILVASWLLIPFMLRDTGAYINWQFPPDFWSEFEAYIGLNMVGIWDELFFVCTVLALLRQHFSFWIANFAQAVLFTSFLYNLAFIGWCIIVIYLFALLQGHIFKTTKSLLFIVAIHLTVDLVLHLALVHLHYPQNFPYFLT